MLSWLRRRHERILQIEAEAAALIHAQGAAAYAVARMHEDESSSEVMQLHWSRIASAIARKSDEQRLASEAPQGPV
jgi:hypothetical protein